jgi:hypothetical protein
MERVVGRTCQSKSGKMEKSVRAPEMGDTRAKIKKKRKERGE